jgi:site-specific recombinase XerD
MTQRNRAILWLLLDTGLSVSEVCGLRLSDVDRAGGTITVGGKGRDTRTLSVSAEGQHAVCAYLEQARLTPAWKPEVREAQEAFLLTEFRRSLTKNCLTLLFERLNQRAGLSRTPICPSMLRETYAIRFLQAGGELAALQEQLGVAGLASVRRYQRFCEEHRREEQQAQVCPEEARPIRRSRQSKSKHGKASGSARARRGSGARKERS